MDFQAHKFNFFLNAHTSSSIVLDELMILFLCILLLMLIIQFLSQFVQWQDEILGSSEAMVMFLKTHSQDKEWTDDNGIMVQVISLIWDSPNISTPDLHLHLCFLPGHSIVSRPGGETSWHGQHREARAGLHNNSEHPGVRNVKTTDHRLPPGAKLILVIW